MCRTGKLGTASPGASVLGSRDNLIGQTGESKAANCVFVFEVTQAVCGFLIRLFIWLAGLVCAFCGKLVCCEAAPRG